MTTPTTLAGTQYRAAAGCALAVLASASCRAGEPSYDWLPPDTAFVTHQRGTAMLFLNSFDRLKDDLPPCYASLRAKVTGSTQLGLDGVSPGVLVFDVAAQRSEFEACVLECVQRARDVVGRGADQPMKRVQQGKVTRFDGPRGFALGFHPGRVVYHDDPAVVARLVDAMSAKRPRPPTSFPPLFARVDPQALVWIIVLRDYASGLAGVPMRGAFASASSAPPTATVVLDNEEAARRLVARFDDPGLPAKFDSIAKVMHGAAKARGVEVDVDTTRLSRLFEVPVAKALLDELAAELLAKPRRPGLGQ